MNAEPDQGEKKIWFPAKKYGWGWGPPKCWQGWAVMLTYVGLAVAGAFMFEPNHHLHLFIGYMVAISLLLCVVCWLKGEKPRWRWGGK